MRPDLPDHHAYRAHDPDSQQHIDEHARRMQDELFPVRGQIEPADKHVYPVRQQPEHRAHASGDPSAQPRHHGHQEHIIDPQLQKHAHQRAQRELHRHLRPTDDQTENRIEQHHHWQIIIAAEWQEARPLMLFPTRPVCQLPLGAVPDDPRENSAAQHPEQQPQRHRRAHSVPSRRSSRSSASSSAVRPLAHSAAANAGRLPPQSVS